MSASPSGKPSGGKGKVKNSRSPRVSSGDGAPSPAKKEEKDSSSDLTGRKESAASGQPTPQSTQLSKGQKQSDAAAGAGAAGADGVSGVGKELICLAFFCNQLYKF